MKMFVLSECKSLVRLAPKCFDKSLPEALTEELNRKLANKVILNVGLCISLYDILEIGESFLFPGDGSSHTRVTFRLLVFHPFIEQVLVGKIKACTKEGVQVSLGFFDDILIPPQSLQHPFRFDEADQVWVWEYPTEDGDHHDLYMDQGEEIRFRVISESFVDNSPAAPVEKSPIHSSISEDPTNIESEKKIPYTIHASVNEPGLGLLSWWNNS